MAEFPRDPDEASRAAEDAETLDHARRPLSGFDSLLMPSAMQTADLMNFFSSVSDTLDKITADLADSTAPAPVADDESDSENPSAGESERS